MIGKKLVALLLVVLMLATTLPFASAADLAEEEAAWALYELGLMKGTGTDAYGNPIFELDRTPTRHEAVTMLVRLLGKEADAANNSWYTPFYDVAAWAAPYVGYAYNYNLTNGISANEYGGNMSTTAAHYITFVLRALGYQSGVDFQWNTAWELSDALGITNGEYNAYSNFTRGDAALISYRALSQYVVGTEMTLLEKIQNGITVGNNQQTETNKLTKEALFKVTEPWGEITAIKVDIIFTSMDADGSSGRALYEYAKITQQLYTDMVSYAEEATRNCGDYEELSEVVVDLATIYAIAVYGSAYPLTIDNAAIYMTEMNVMGKELMEYEDRIGDTLYDLTLELYK